MSLFTKLTPTKVMKAAGKDVSLGVQLFQARLSLCVTGIGTHVGQLLEPGLGFPEGGAEAPCAVLPLHGRVTPPWDLLSRSEGGR